MRRREFIALAGGAVATPSLLWPLATYGQQTAFPVIGFLNSASADGYAAMAASFKQGLKETGHVEGQNVRIEYRWADNAYDRLPALAAELVSRRVALIVTNGPGIAAVEAATRTIPIAFMTGDDPVRLGFVASISRPGGNATGITIFSGELAAKRLGLLRELIPQAKTIAVLVNTGWPAAVRFQADVEIAARMMGLLVQVLKANTDAEIDDAFNRMAQNRADALLVGPGPFYDSVRDKLVALAAKVAVPAAFESHSTAVAGGLISYGASVQDGYRQLGTYAGRILNGEKPTDIPVMLPTRFELVINLKTARTLGLTIPPGVLAIADEVIE
jgi:putative tryptophan/tyrosine transport system substrate-binding protein